MPGLLQSRVAARLIAILTLVGLCAEGTRAQYAPQLLVATLGPSDLVAQPAPAATRLESSGLAAAKILRSVFRPRVNSDQARRPCVLIGIACRRALAAPVFTDSATAKAKSASNVHSLSGLVLSLI